jgi:dCTP deaminase
MTQLVDWQIREQRKIQEANGINLIEPFNESQLQPASYDLRLGGQIRTETGLAYDLMEYKGPVPGWSKALAQEDMEPGRFLLAHTMETIHVPPHLCARVEGKSTWARMGLQVHSAGFVDPGFKGQLTLELVNHANLKHFKLRRGMLIAQISFFALAARPERLYGDPGVGSHYQNQVGATPAAK